MSEMTQSTASYQVGHAAIACQCMQPVYLPPYPQISPGYDKIAAWFILPSCIQVLQSKRSSFVVALSLPVEPEVTITVAYLFIGMSVLDTYRALNPSSHWAMTLEEVRLLSLAIFVPLSNFCPFPSRQGTLEGTIGKLSDYILLTIFRCYLDSSPLNWPNLVHICRRWRRIVFASQRSLHLRLFCTPGTPVLKTLSFWPGLPIAVQYGGSPRFNPLAPEDEDNVVAALKQSDRVSSISLTVTKPLLEKLSAIERPFPELENLVLLCGDDVPLILSSSAFQWGPRLRSLHLTRVAIPALPRLLFLSTSLVELQLHEISDVGYISPKVLANALSGMPHLRTLSLHFLSSASNPDFTGLPPPSKHITLLALRKLKYRGTSKYLEILAARIDASRLGNIDVTFFSQPLPMDLQQLDQFINRIAMHKSHRQADILLSENAISISFTQPESPTRLELQVTCDSFSLQLEYMAQICNCLNTFPFGIEYLRVCATSGRHYPYLDPYREGWQNLLTLFRSTKWAYVTRGISTSILIALQRPRQGPSLLPALHKLCIQEPNPPQQRKVVGSFIHSRLLSGHIIAVEYERLRINELDGAGTTLYQRKLFLSLTDTLRVGICRDQQVMIEMLPDDILWNIFHHYLYPSLKIWPTLTHVCRSWRQIVFRYPLGLDLRLYCTYGIPVQKTLECWPPFPLVVKYGGFPELNPPALEDDDNIIAALKQSGRVSSISLTVTSSLIEKLPVITEPLSGLEKLVLLSRDNVQLTLPSSFRWGSRLRTLHSTRVAIPSFPRLFLPCQDLTDIQLREIPRSGYFSPEELANALSGVTNLRNLSLHFLSFPSRREYRGPSPPPEERVLLPALTCFKYRGTSKYLDSFVARIDAPRLGDIDITFFSQPTMDASQLGRFIGRIEMETSLSRAEVKISVHTISVTFLDQSTAKPLRVRIPCKQLDWQLSAMAQICKQFSPFLFRVEDLRISSTYAENGMAGDQWRELIRAFSGAKDCHVAGRVHVTEILCALRPADETVLPTLHNLHVSAYMRVGMPLWDAAESFLASRQLSGHPVELYAHTMSCHICPSGFTRQHELKRHLVDQHSYRIYCGDFQCNPYLLAGRHPTALDIFGPFTRLQLEANARVNSDVTRYESLV